MFIYKGQRYTQKPVKHVTATKYMFYRQIVNLFTDETVYNGTCIPEADSCTYPNALCGDNGLCGCELGLTYDPEFGGCCKSFLSKAELLECFIKTCQAWMNIELTSLLI